MTNNIIRLTTLLPPMKSTEIDKMIENYIDTYLQDMRMRYYDGIENIAMFPLAVLRIIIDIIFYCSKHFFIGDLIPINY